MFFEDGYCHYANMGDSFRKCRQIINGYDMDMFKTYSLDVAQNIFWKIDGEKEEDGNKFRVTLSEPKNGATNVTRNPSELIFYFNRNIDPDFLNSIQIDFGEIFISYRTTVTQNSIMMKVMCMDRYLVDGKTYKIKLIAEAEGAGKSRLVPFNLTFTTGDMIDKSGPPAIGPNEPDYEKLCL